MRNEKFPEILNQKQAAKFLGIGIATLWRYAKKGLIPHKKLNRRCLYSKQALVSWIAGSNGKEEVKDEN
jgi:predicted site-specific integrase-resolvase